VSWRSLSTRTPVRRDRVALQQPLLVEHDVVVGVAQAAQHRQILNEPAAHDVEGPGIVFQVEGRQELLWVPNKENPAVPIQPPARSQS